MLERHRENARGAQRWAGIQVRPQGTGKVSSRMKERHAEEWEFGIKAALLCWGESESVGLCTLGSKGVLSNCEEDLLFWELKWGSKPGGAAPGAWRLGVCRCHFIPSLQFQRRRREGFSPGA